MSGPGFNQVFGGGPVAAAQASYSALAFAVSQALVWPTQAPSGSPIVTRIMDCTPGAGSLSITLPPANAQGLGTDILINNNGAFTFTLLSNTGTTIASIAPGQQYYVYLTNNTTVGGTWGAFLFGAGSSALSAAAIAGTGMIALGATLSPNFLSSIASASPLNLSATTDRAAQYVWTGGTGAANLPPLSSIPTPLGYFVILNNKGSGALIVTPNGADTVDGAATETLNPGYSAAYFATSAGWYSFGNISNTKFAFTELVQTVTGGTLTLSQTQAANVVQKYQGVLGSNQTVVFPPTVQVYYVQNATTGAFNLTFKSGAGSQITVPSGQNAVLFSDGTNVINCATTVSGLTSLLLGQGSQSTPAIGFSVDPSTGLYQSATGHLDFTISGTQRFDLTATMLTLLGPAMTINAPASGNSLIVNALGGAAQTSFSGIASSTDTASYYNGSRILIQNSSNTVGNFGTISFVAQGGNDAAAIWTMFNAHGAGAASGTLNFGTTNAAGAATARMTINNTGNVTINAPTSGFALTVNSSAAAAGIYEIATGSGVAGTFAIQGDSGTRYWITANANSGSPTSPNNLQIGGNGGATPGLGAITINPSGNVTINAPSSGNALTVTAGSGLAAVLNGQTVGIVNGGFAAFVANSPAASNSGFQFQENSVNKWYLREGGVASGTLDFYSFTTNASQGNITGAGNWTINTPGSGSSPTLVIGNGSGSNGATSGATTLRMWAGATNNYLMDLWGSTSTNNPSLIRWGSNDTLTIYGELGVDSTQMYLGTWQNTTLGLYTNAVSRVNISGSGNVTINATGSGYPLTVSDTTGSNTSFASNVAGYAQVILNNANAGGSAQYTVQGNNGGVIVTLQAQTGGIGSVGTNTAHSFNINTNGGTRISIVNSTGNVAIQSPVSGNNALTVNSVSGTHSTKIGDSGTTLYNAGFLEVPPQAQTANYTCVLADSGKSIDMNGTSLTVTIPANGSVAYPTGTCLTFTNLNSSNLSIAINTDTLTKAGSTTTGTRTLAQNGVATARKVSSTSWIISGTGLS